MKMALDESLKTQGRRFTSKTKIPEIVKKLFSGNPFSVDYILMYNILKNIAGLLWLAHLFSPA